MLMPPVIDSFMPSFNYTKQVRVYFSISTYNSLPQIAQAQVVVRYQTNNANALNTTAYPNKIKCCQINQVTSGENAAIASTASRFYIVLTPDDIINGFNPTTLYKVQIRFSTVSYDSKTSIATLARTASEWSTVCLLKPIIVPTFSVAGLEETKINSNNSTYTIISTTQPNFTGTYTPGTPSETLKYWRMRLYDEGGNNVLADSGIQTVNNYQTSNGEISFKVNLKYAMSNNTSYRLVLDIQTKNGYTASKYYDFTAQYSASAAPNASVSLTIDQEDGYAKVVLMGDGSIVNTNILLRRTSSKSNFVIWEDLCNYTLKNVPMQWQYDDFSIESGVFYQYAIQTRDSYGRRSSMIKTEKAMKQFDDCFLTEHGEFLSSAVQLKIKYDMNISNTAINVGESKTDTIGSKYPFVRRNGNMYYHSFPFSFLITAYTDDNYLFAKRSQIFNSLQDNYIAARDNKHYTVAIGKYDYTYERQFRKKVEAFLYDNKVKLFRSLTQGNMLIKLMSITLTPNQDLGRLIYSVDATAVEIAEPTLENIDYYGIQRLGTYDPNISYEQDRIGQLNRIYSVYQDAALGGYNLQNITTEKGQNLATANGEDIIATSGKNTEEGYQQLAYPAGFNIMGEYGQDSLIPTISSRYHLGKSLDNIITKNLYLTYLRIEIDSDPYLIKNVNGKLLPLDDIPPTADTVDSETILGTLLNINGTTVLIEYPNTIYEMKDPNLHIGYSWSISPLKDTKMLIDYNVHLFKAFDNSKVASTIIYRAVNGQFFDTFDSLQSLNIKIWYKYYNDFYQCKNIKNPYYTKVNNIYTLDVEAQPNTVMYVQTNVSDDFVRLVINETGDLFIDPGIQNGVIKEAYFYGINIDSRLINIKASKPAYPQQYDAYILNDVTYIYHHGEWRKTTRPDNDSYDIACPVDGIVNYYIQVEKGIY